MRIFMYDGREFPDPDPSKPPEEVKEMFSNFFPELANADIRTQERGEDTLYILDRKVGTKGNGPAYRGA